jgi:hypothetical protein
MIITKSYLTALIEKGFGVKEIKVQIADDLGMGKSPSFKQIKLWLNEAGLQVKPKVRLRKPTFEFFDDTLEVGTPPIEEEEEEVNSFHADLAQFETERAITNY